MVRLVTDSNAFFFDPTFVQKHHIRVLPLGVRLGNEVLPETALTTEQLFHRLGNSELRPTLEAPTPEQFTAVFQELAQTTDSIVCIHFSGKLSRTPDNARTGAETLLGRMNIQVIDSGSVSLGLGVLVEAAARAAINGATVEEIVKIVRGHIPRLYGAFFCNTMAYAGQLPHIRKAHAILGEMLDIKPVLALEDGDLIPIEKARTRMQAIERLVEYAVEFTEVERCAILQATPRPTEDTRALLEQLAEEAPGLKWPVIAYTPALATLLGPEAMGVMVYESDATVF
ncbi:MAG: DegV family protein [Anaerolineales bacterium]|nr:DegV family protein [Anaerolineales bacterium]